jgi:hypothetical protein
MPDTNNTPLTSPLTDSNLEPLLGEVQNVQNNYSYVTGGPNQSLINQLNQQSKQKAQQYKQNRADASNMYGQLTQTVDQGINAVQQGYGQAITQGRESALGATSALGNQLQQQVAQRQKTANELGMGQQVAATPFQTANRTNDAMANILQTNTNWTGLLNAQQQAAKQQGVDTKTALGQSKNQTMLALQQALQQGQGNIANQIAAEQGKVGTTQLTPMGDILMGGLKTKIQGYMNPAANSGIQRIQTAVAGFNADPGLAASIALPGQSGRPDDFVNPETGESGPQAWYDYYYNQVAQAVSANKWNAGGLLDPKLQRFADAVGIRPGFLTNSVGAINNSQPSSSYTPGTY